MQISRWFISLFVAKNYTKIKFIVYLKTGNDWYKMLLAIFGDAAEGDGDSWECLEIDSKWSRMAWALNWIAAACIGDEAECNRMAAEYFVDGTDWGGIVSHCIVYAAEEGGTKARWFGEEGEDDEIIWKFENVGIWWWDNLKML